MKKIRYKLALIVLLVVLNITVLYQLVRTRKRSTDLSFLNTETNSQLAYYKDQAKRLQENTAFYLKANNKGYTFLDSFGVKAKKTILALRIHDGDCNQCVKESMFSIKENGIDKKFTIIILADFPTLKAVTDHYLFDYPVFITGEIGPDSLYNSRKPFYFTVTNGKMGNFFIPEWDAMPLFKTYIDELAAVHADKI